MRESLEIDMAEVKYGQEKVLNRVMETLLRQMCGNLCSGKWKHFIEIWRYFVLSDGFAFYFHQFQNLCSTFSRLLFDIWQFDFVGTINDVFERISSVILGW